MKKTGIGAVWKNVGDKMLFLFDYGDEWRWIITLNGFGEKKSDIKYPRVLSSNGDAPEQYRNSRKRKEMTMDRQHMNQPDKGALKILFNKKEQPYWRTLFIF